MCRNNAAARCLLVCVFGLLASICFASASADRLAVYTVNYPLQYFAERIGGDHVEVYFPAPQNVDPAFWFPDAATVLAYQQADLIFLNGAAYAGWVNRVSLPRLRTVDTSSGFADGFIKETDEVTHSHGPGGEHSHSGTAFTTWLDFTQALQQAEAILQALQHKRPEHSDYFAVNFNALKQDLQTLDAELLAVVDTLEDRRFMASHPVYQYLARRYGLDLFAMTWEPGVFPEPGQWQAFADRQSRGARQWMLWEAEPLAETARRLADMGVGVGGVSPAMNRPAEGDFLDVMQGNIHRLGQAVDVAR